MIITRGRAKRPTTQFVIMGMWSLGSGTPNRKHAIASLVHDQGGFVRRIYQQIHLIMEAVPAEPPDSHDPQRERLGRGAWGA